MLGADVVVPERPRRFLRLRDRILRPGGEPLEHRYLAFLPRRPPCFLCTACRLTPSTPPICSHDQPRRRALSTCSSSSRSRSRPKAATARNPTSGSLLLAALANSVACVTV